jgi:hypothetical protein
VPGYNHYADCICGWCINYGRTPVNRGALVSEMRERDARLFLDRNSARSISGCFVNPNARCPVCSAAVFFYANQFGSRVYFDELGPPWPKHPCTDNPRGQNGTVAGSSGAPTRRTKGLMQELITAANTAGIFRSKVVGVRIASDWTLLVVASIERRGEKNTVKAEFLDSLIHEATEFTCFSSVPMFEIGDFLSKRGSEISFLHKVSLTPIVFVVGGSVSLPQKDDVAPKSVSSHSPQTTKKRDDPAPKQKGDGPKYEMTTSEMVHYHSESVTVAELCAKLAPIVKTYAREGTRKPRDVSIRLNFDGHKTASGAQWTPRLTHFLLGLIFLDPKSPKEGRQTKPTRVQAPKATTPRREDGPLTQEELVRRLSALGRVVVKGQ